MILLTDEPKDQTLKNEMKSKIFTHCLKMKRPNI